MQELSLNGYHTAKPVTLFYHDPLECIEALLQNPIFEGKWNFIPRRIYDSPDRRNRLYNKWMTGDAAWAAQVSTPQYPHDVALTCTSPLSLQVEHYLALPFPPTRRTYPL